MNFTRWPVNSLVHFGHSSSKGVMWHAIFVFSQVPTGNPAQGDISFCTHETMPRIFHINCCLLASWLRHSNKKVKHIISSKSNPVLWQRWQVAYPGWMLQMKMLFPGWPWPIVVHDTHKRRRSSKPAVTLLWINQSHMTQMIIQSHLVQESGIIIVIIYGKCYYKCRAHWYSNLLPVRRPLIWNSITSGGTILV